MATAEQKGPAGDTVFDEMARRHVLDRLIDGLYIYDVAAGYNTYVNAKYSEMTGYSLEDLSALSGDEFLALFHDEDRAAVLDHMEQVANARDGEVFEIDYRFRVASGDWIWCRSRDCVLDRQADGRMKRMIGYFSDVSVRKLAVLEVLRDQARKDEFLATLSHELRNPLAPIQSSVEILRFAGQNEATRDRALGIIEHQIAHLVHLINDLMDISRITRGAIELKKARISLAELVTSVVDSARAHYDADDRVFEVQLPSESLFLEGDRVRLEQVIFNLLDNAARYSAKGTPVRVVADSDGDDVRVSVLDDGQGLDPDEVEEIFELFHQVDGAAGGLGIGLTLARSIIEQHGGAISVESQGRGSGSVFRIRLPRATSAGPKKPASDSPRAVLDAKRVLVVDDNQDAAESLGMLLGTYGAAVDVAYDGESALAAVARFRPEIVLLDIGMPGMDGYEVAGRLRQLEGGEDLLLIALTGWAQPRDVRRSESAGFDVHLTKPVNADRVSRLIADRTSQ